jgi:hypothetical protein
MTPGFVIIDLDRPRRGLIEVRQESMLALKAAIDAGEMIGDGRLVEPAEPTSPPSSAGP